MKDIRGIVAWLDDGARSASGPQGLMDELCSRLAGAGIPLERASIFVTMLHPDIAGLGSIWVAASLSNWARPLTISSGPTRFSPRSCRESGKAPGLRG